MRTTFSLLPHLGQKINFLQHNINFNSTVQPDYLRGTVKANSPLLATG